MGRSERVSHAVFAACAGLVVVTMAAIFIFVGSNAYQTFTVNHVSPAAFFGTASWSPDEGHVGSLALIVGSVVTTLLAVLVATPVGAGVAIFVSEIAPAWARQIMQPALELLTGIPSIIFGFIGLVALVPWVRQAMGALFGIGSSAGFGVIPAAIVLTVMILPTITTLSIDALAGLPQGLREGSLALGATRWQMIRRTLLPAASSGIFTGVILGMGRAIGETLAVALVIGAVPNNFPIKFFDTSPTVRFPSTSTITAQLLADFREATSGTLNYNAIWTLAFVLLLISFLLVLAGRYVASRSAYRAAPRGERSGGRLGARIVAIAGRRGA